MKRKIIPRQEFVTYASFPLVAGDVRAYEIQLDLGEDISGAEFKITAIRSDGTVVEDIGSVSGGIASYTVAGSMYSVPGELTVRLSVIHNSSVLTDREIIFEVLENVSGTDTAYTTVNINDSVILRISALEDKLSGKVDRISGKGLSSNDFTDEYKAVLEGLDDNISQKLGSLDEHIGNVSNPHKVTAVQVGAYTKEDIDARISEINRVMGYKANKSDISNVYKYRGSVAEKDLLPFEYKFTVNGAPYIIVDGEKQEIGAYDEETGIITIDYSATVDKYTDIYLPVEPVTIKKGWYGYFSMNQSGILVEYSDFSLYICSNWVADGATMLEEVPEDVVIDEIDCFFGYGSLENRTLSITGSGTLEISLIKTSYDGSLEYPPDKGDAENLSIGDVYNIFDTDENFAWTGTGWDALGGNHIDSEAREDIENIENRFDLTVEELGVVGTKASANEENIAALRADIENIENQLGLTIEELGVVGSKLSENTYSKDEVDEKCAVIEEAVETRVSEATDNLSGSLDEHIGSINNPHKVTAVQVGSYTKAEVDELLSQKADTEVYTKNVFANALKGSATGEVISLNDVSPAEHTLEVTARSKNLVDLSKWSARNCIMNDDGTVTCNINNSGYAEIYSKTLISGILLANKGKTITFSIGETLEDRFVSLVIYGKKADGSSLTIAPYKKNSNTISAVISEELASISEVDLRFNWLSSTTHTDTTTVITNIQLEIGEAATEYTPYIEDVSAAKVTVAESGDVYTPNADGTVEGVKSIYPNTTLMTDTSGVLIDCEYNKDLNKAFEEVINAIISLGGNV